MLVTKSVPQNTFTFWEVSFRSFKCIGRDVLGRWTSCLPLLLYNKLRLWLPAGYCSIFILSDKTSQPDVVLYASQLYSTWALCPTVEYRLKQTSSTGNEDLSIFDPSVIPVCSFPVCEGLSCCIIYWKHIECTGMNVNASLHRCKVPWRNRGRESC